MLNLNHGKISQKLVGNRESLGFPSGSVVKEPPAVQEMQVRSLGGEDPLEEGMVTYSSFLPGESHGQRSLAGDGVTG